MIPFRANETEESKTSGERPAGSGWVVARAFNWGFSLFWDRNDPPYYARLMIHFGPWVFVR